MTVLGCDVNERGQCVHYHSDRDVVAIRFKCCDKFYACILCHQELADHIAVVWPKSERDNHAVLCGNCRSTLSIADYLNCENLCPRCGAAFNSGCANHYHLYFEL
jgi:uncharacterized CHY-type Zn-finger protein